MIETSVDVDLAVDHVAPVCLDFAWTLGRQLSNGYTRDASMMELPASIGDWRAAHRTARKRADRSRRIGYRFEQIVRHGHEDDVYAINVSKPVRQGRPMTAGYGERPAYGDEPMLCPLHHVYPYGVLLDDRLVAYLWLYRCGELAMISSILGHADHLSNDVMYLLVAGAIERQAPLGGTLFYNLHASGTDGLRYFKERIGLAPMEVSWRH